MEDPPQENKGVVELIKMGNMALIERDFVLGKGIPGYK